MVMKVYSPEFKVDAAALYHSDPDLAIAQVVRDLGIRRDTLRRWIDAADAQRQAVAAAVAGQSFVLDGPPGTGKSQTITNVIAGLMHVGRSVLFVSEKAAGHWQSERDLRRAATGTCPQEPTRQPRGDTVVAVGTLGNVVLDCPDSQGRAPHTSGVADAASTTTRPTWPSPDWSPTAQPCGNHPPANPPGQHAPPSIAHQS